MNKEQLKIYKTQLAEIDYKLKNKRTYEEGEIHRSTGLRFLGKWKENYTLKELELLWEMKSAIIDLLIKEGHISNEGRKQFFLSENDTFTPEIIEQP